MTLSTLVLGKLNKALIGPEATMWARI